MKLNCFLLMIVLIFAAVTAAPLYASSLEDSLKGALKDATDELTGAKGKDAADQKESSGEGKAVFNLQRPSKQEEVQIGREIAGNLLGASPLVNDAALQKYVNQVGRWVANQSERADLDWHFGVIDSEDINAFAAPGGYVIITRGLYRKLENEAQLAGVLSHEIAHVVRKHHLKILQQSQLIDIGAGLLGKQIGKEAKGEKDIKLIQRVIGSGAEICARSLDKSAEFEADRMGVSLTTRAGYEPYGLPEVLQTIGLTAKDDSSVSLLFKTHPHPDERLVQLDDAIGSRLDKINGGKTLSNRFYRLKN